MTHPLCLLRALWWSLKHGAMVSGHDYVIQEPAPANIQVTRCRTCGHYDVTWCWPKDICPNWMQAKGHQYVGAMKIIAVKENKS